MNVTLHNGGTKVARYGRTRYSMHSSFLSVAVLEASRSNRAILSRGREDVVELFASTATGHLVTRCGRAGERHVALLLNRCRRRQDSESFTVQTDDALLLALAGTSSS